LMSSGGLGPNVMDIALVGNRLEGMELKVKAVPADGSRRSGYRIIDNVSDVSLGTSIAALKFHWVDGLEVRGNYQEMNERRDMTAVYACESTGVEVADNNFPGAAEIVRLDPFECPAT